MADSGAPATLTASATSSSGASEHQLLHQQLLEPDAIFQPNANDLVRDFLKHGKPEEVVVSLSSSYRGFAEMVNLVGHWLEDTGMPAADIQKQLVEAVSTRVKTLYDPQCTRSVFQTKNRNIQWMNFMVGNAYWRTVLYELSERHKSDQVLAMALARIEELGHQDELATVLLGFPLFNQGMVQSVTKMLTLDEEALLEELPKFKKMCCQSANAYLYSQLVLLTVARQESGDRLMRLFEELEKHALMEHEKSRVVPRIGYLLMGVSKDKELASGIFALLESGRTNPADVAKIHKAFSQEGAPRGGEAPSAEFLLNAALLEMLVSDLYTAAREISPKFLDKYVFCLANAVSEGVPEEVELAQRAIEISSSVAKKNLFGPQLEQHVPLLEHYIARFPVVSMGLLRWIRSNMCDRGYYEKGTHSLSLKRFLDFVIKIGATHVRQRRHCVDLLENAYETIEQAQTEEGIAGEAASVKTMILEALVELLKTDDTQVVGPVMAWIEGLAKRGTTDSAILRAVVKKVLENTEPPFAQVFVEFVAGLLVQCIPEHPNFGYVQQLLSVFNVPGSPQSLVHKFLERALQRKDTLSPKAVELLAVIATRVSPKPKVAPIPAAAQQQVPPAPPQPAAIVKSSTVIKIANLDPSVIKKTLQQDAAAAVSAVGKDAAKGKAAAGAANNKKAAATAKGGDKGAAKKGAAAVKEEKSPAKKKKESAKKGAQTKRERGAVKEEEEMEASPKPAAAKKPQPKKKKAKTDGRIVYDEDDEEDFVGDEPVAVADGPRKRLPSRSAASALKKELKLIVPTSAAAAAAKEQPKILDEDVFMEDFD